MKIIKNKNKLSNKINEEKLISRKTLKNLGCSQDANKERKIADKENNKTLFSSKKPSLKIYDFKEICKERSNTSNDRKIIRKVPINFMRTMRNLILNSNDKKMKENKNNYEKNKRLKTCHNLIPLVGKAIQKIIPFQNIEINSAFKNNRISLDVNINNKISVKNPSNQEQNIERVKINNQKIQFISQMIKRRFNYHLNKCFLQFEKSNINRFYSLSK